MVSVPYSLWVNAGDNCGIGPGGFQPGNTCAKGDGISAYLGKLPKMSPANLKKIKAINGDFDNQKVVNIPLALKKNKAVVQQIEKATGKPAKFVNAIKMMAAKPAKSEPAKSKAAISKTDAIVESAMKSSKVSSSTVQAGADYMMKERDSVGEFPSKVQLIEHLYTNKGASLEDATNAADALIEEIKNKYGKTAVPLSVETKMVPSLLQHSAWLQETAQGIKKTMLEQPNALLKMYHSPPQALAVARVLDDLSTAKTPVSSQAVKNVIFANMKGSAAESLWEMVRDKVDLIESKPASAAVSKKRSFLGSSMQDRMDGFHAMISEKAGFSPTSGQLTKVAGLNDGSDNSTLYVPLALKSKLGQIQKAFPDKKVVAINALSALKKKNAPTPSAASAYQKAAAKYKSAAYPLPKKPPKPPKSKAYAAKSSRAKSSKSVAFEDHIADGDAVKVNVSPLSGSIANAAKGYWSKIKSMSAKFAMPVLKWNSPNSDTEDMTYAKMFSEWGSDSDNMAAYEMPDLPKFESTLKGHSKKSIKAADDAWQAALDMGPKYEGVTWRGEALLTHDYITKKFKPTGESAAKRLEELSNVGSVVEFHRSYSTSRSFDKARVFGNVVMRIQSKTGVPVDKLTGHPYEEEVIARKNSKYEVVSVAKDVKVNGKSVPHLITLREI